MKIYYIANARIPTEKAHGIQIAKMCEALIEAGTDLTLIVPSRGDTTTTLQEFYGLRVSVPTIVITVPNYYIFGKVGFLYSSIFFMYVCMRFLQGKRKLGEKFQIYSVDMDTFSYALLPLSGATSIEMHSPKKATLANRFFFKRVTHVIATNSLIQRALVETFALQEGVSLVAPNGFDIPSYTKTREEARSELGIPMETRLLIYVGRALSWKGMEVLPKALQNLPDDISCYLVGVTQRQLHEISGGLIPKGFVAVGERPPAEVQVWLAAADIGLVLGTKENESSFRYTSPMKVFEYIGAALPIVASDTPALLDVLSDSEAFLYKHDNPESLKDTVLRALSSRAEALKKAEYARVAKEKFSWKHRAETVRNLLKNTP